MSVVDLLVRRQRLGEPHCISQDAQRSSKAPPVCFRRSASSDSFGAKGARSRGHKLGGSGQQFFHQWTAMLRHQSLNLDCFQPDDLNSWGADAWGRANDLLDSTAFCRHPPYRIENSKWLLPIYRSLEKGGAFGHDHTEMLLLDEQGAAIGAPVPVLKCWAGAWISCSLSGWRGTSPVFSKSPSGSRLSIGEF